MTEIDLDRLEALAKAATPGPWYADPMEYRGSTPDWGVVQGASLGRICFVGDPYPRGENNPGENMDYIAAVSPDVLLALIERLRKRENWIRGCWMNDEFDRCIDCGEAYRGKEPHAPDCEIAELLEVQE